ncbi:MAG: rhombosortase [Pirellulales bacterium]|nr:rhombosortase [Pirellulales bacterium]
MTANFSDADRGRPLATYRPMAAVGCAILAVAIWLVPGAAEWLQFDRGAIAAGEIWRIVSGHLTHWNGDHLLWDVLMFAVLGALVERTSRASFLATTVLSALAISAALWFLQPAQVLYRGLSGIDSALFVFQAIWLAREALSEKRFAASVLPMVALAGFVGKVGYEYASGCTLFVDSAAAGFAPLPLAHVIGGLVGAAVLAAREAATCLTRVDEGPWRQWSARLSR